MTRQIYCHICGGPFLSGDDTWLGEAMVLSTGHRTQDGIDVDEFWPCGLDQNGFCLAAHLSGQANRVLLRLRFPPREPGLIGFGIVPVPGFPTRASS